MDNEKKRLPSDVIGMYYNRQLNFLISFDGKKFLNNIGGYRKQKIINDLKIQAIKDENALRKRNERRLVLGTFLVAAGAIGLIAWEILKFGIERSWGYPEYSKVWLICLSIAQLILLGILLKKKS